MLFISQKNGKKIVRMLIIKKSYNLHFHFQSISDEFYQEKDSIGFFSLYFSIIKIHCDHFNNCDWFIAQYYYQFLLYLMIQCDWRAICSKLYSISHLVSTIYTLSNRLYFICINFNIYTDFVCYFSLSLFLNPSLCVSACARARRWCFTVATIS